jgi:hypothetical protein
LSQKVRPRKTWLLGSSNSARRTARKSTGSAALCASWKPENSIAGASPRGSADRARAAAGKVERTKNMVLYYLLSRDLKKIEGYQFTLRAQKNSQDSVRITDEAAVPKSYCRIDARIDGVLWETVLSLLPDELAKSPWSRLFRRRDRTRTRSKPSWRQSPPESRRPGSGPRRNPKHERAIGCSVRQLSGWSSFAQTPQRLLRQTPARPGLMLP